MDRSTRALAIAAAALCLANCGDPFIVTGDTPGVVRIVAGIPETPGDSLGALATESFLDTPHGLATGPDGTLYIADMANDRVLAVNSAGQVEVLVDHTRRFVEPRLRTPVGLALDGSGGLLIADSAGLRVWRLELESGVAAPIAGTGGSTESDTSDALATDLRKPIGVAAGPDGRVYISEYLVNKVRRIESDGSITTVAGSGLPGFGGDGGPAYDALLLDPFGLFIAGDVLYIADSGNHRVRAVDLDSFVIETVAGSGNAGFGGDGGPATEALLDTPVSVTVTDDGRFLFISDAGNHRVRLVNLETGTISTFAGTGDVVYSGDLLTAGATSLASPKGVAASPFNLLFMSDTGHQVVLRTALGI
jgi:sugar lactone lactonase YvrE